MSSPFLPGTRKPRVSLNMLSVSMLYAKLNFVLFSGLNTYVYAFTTLDTREAYATMFSRIFQILGDVARCPVKFPYIHGGEEGIRVATVDMCRKQAPGKYYVRYILLCSIPAEHL